jgi:hypothetical protein
MTSARKAVSFVPVCKANSILDFGLAKEIINNDRQDEQDKEMMNEE